MLDMWIRNGTVIDGLGGPAFTGNIGIKDGKIVSVGEGNPAWEAERVMDAEGMWVMPGFVDIHRHGDLVPFSEKLEAEELRQGITTFINGNCGFSVSPSSGEYFELLRDYAGPIMGEIPEVFKGLGQSEFLQIAEKGRLSSNVGYLVGNGALRIAVKGFDPSPLTKKEMARVKELLRESLEGGALGLSLGLMYVPENFYSFEELEEICRVPADMGRVITAHMRGEGSSLLESVEEIIHLAESCGGRFHISHLKAAGKKNWDYAAKQVLEKIQEARSQGIDIDFDVYPYCAGSTALYTLLPPAIMEGGMEKTLERLKDSEIRERLCRELREEQDTWDNLVVSTGWDSVVIMGGSENENVGKSIKQLAQERSVCPEECMMDLLLESKGDVPIVFYSMCSEDMERILKSPESIVISDALYSKNGIAHPRKYGAFSRFICEYKDKMKIEEMVSKITFYPARRMGITDRGILKAGYQADVVVISPEKFKDRAVYESPKRYPEGIRCVIVNGHIAYENGTVKGCFGNLLRQNQCRRSAWES